MDRWRSEEAQQYRKLYSSRQWRMLRERALLRDSYRCQHQGCGIYLRKGRSGDNAAVVHHIKPHKGDLALFFDLDNLQSVCKRHHDSDLQSIEARGYDTTIGPDGWPIDPQHPGA
jgi:5-methylcytosine-specific restriction protein A